MIKHLLHVIKRNSNYSINYYRTNHTDIQSTTIVLERLKSRALLQIRGQQTEDFLQGLITNDMKHLKDSSSSMYTMFLNSKGRVLVDSIIYRTSELNTYILELDSTMVATLQKHLKFYLLRKKIEISNLESSYNLWVLLDPKLETKSSKLANILSNNKNSSPDLLIYKDPRIHQLGIRLLIPKDVSEDNIRANFEIPPESNDTVTYKSMRYQLGVGEGPIELPPEKSFPLEVNGDYLHGISFQKGCYLGQELTARTYHLGVIRKRLMPLVLSGETKSEDFVALNESILDDQNKSVGKLRGVEKKFGLGLLRIENALKSKELIVGNVKATTNKPEWWPIEASKEPLRQSS